MENIEKNPEIKTSEKADRLEKLKALGKMNVNAYPAKSKRNTLVKQVIEKFDELFEFQTEVIIAGRLRSKRSHGNLSFANLEDFSGTIQAAFSKKAKTKISSPCSPHQGSWECKDKKK